MANGAAPIAAQSLRRREANDEAPQDNKFLKWLRFELSCSEIANDNLNREPSEIAEDQFEYHFLSKIIAAYEGYLSTGEPPFTPQETENSA